MRTFAQKPKATQQTTSAKSTIPGRVHFGQSRELNSILHLQRTIGNQAVQRMLQTNAEELKAGLTGTASPHFGHDFSRIPIHPPAAGALQTKLAINKPGDIYEQEADRIADQVLATPADPAVSGAPPRIQRFSGQSNRQMDKAPASVDQTLASPGRPFEPALRQDMEQRFGHDFSRVRVHSGAAAELSARKVNANAYTVGHNIVFGAGRFVPGTHEGRRLIAHELTHVVQQSGEQKQPMLQRKEENNADLAAIQGLPMYELLTRLSTLPENILDDEEAGGFVGGPRLVIAMRAVKAKMQKDIDFLTNNRRGIQALPPDQAADILDFLSLPDERKSQKTIK